MKLKIGLCIGYNGKGYCGLQLNKDLNTIEKKIAESLYKCNAISKLNAEDPSKIHMKSSSRTDKGVHAAFNLICCKIETEITPEFVEKLKSELKSNSIYLYKILRLTKSFLPTKQTSSRIYEYIIPTYFLKEGNFTEEVNNLKVKDENTEKCEKRRYDGKDIECILGYRSTQEDIESFKKIFNMYLGTKSYHNFTTLSNPNGKSRFIKSISISDAYIVDDIEYIKITMEGQSFLLHQIRKMTYFAILLCKYKRSNFESIFSKAFEKGYMHIPKGPGQYLLLDSPIFMSVKDKGKMTDTLEVDLEEKCLYKEEVIYKEIHDKSNLCFFLAALDSSRFYSDKLEYLT